MEARRRFPRYDQGGPTNLPASHKMMDPRYREVKKEQIPEVALPGGALVRVVSGRVHGVQGPVKDIVTEPEYLDVTLPANAMFRHPVERGHNVFAYVVEGDAFFDPERDPYARDTVGRGYFDATR